MFRASRSEAFFDASRPQWVDQLLSRESLEKTGYFDAEGVLRERKALAGKSTITVSGRLEYQACDDKVCYQPGKVPVRFDVTLKQ